LYAAVRSKNIDRDAVPIGLNR